MTAVTSQRTNAELTCRELTLLAHVADFSIVYFCTNATKILAVSRGTNRHHENYNGNIGDCLKILTKGLSWYLTIARSCRALKQ